MATFLVFTDDRFPKCSWAHVLINHAFQQRVEPRPILACDGLYLSQEAPFTPDHEAITCVYEINLFNLRNVPKSLFLDRSTTFPLAFCCVPSACFWNVLLQQIQNKRIFAKESMEVTRFNIKDIVFARKPCTGKRGQTG